MLQRSLTLTILALTLIPTHSDQPKVDEVKPRQPAISSDPKDWPSYNADVLGTRHNRGEQALNKDNAANLIEKWRFPPTLSLTIVGVIHATPVVVNGHVYRNAKNLNMKAEDGELHTFGQRTQLFLGDGKGHFQLVKEAGPYFQEQHVGRGVGQHETERDGADEIADQQRQRCVVGEQYAHIDLRAWKRLSRARRQRIDRPSCRQPWW